MAWELWRFLQPFGQQRGEIGEHDCKDSCFAIVVRSSYNGKESRWNFLFDDGGGLPGGKRGRWDRYLLVH